MDNKEQRYAGRMELAAGIILTLLAAILGFFNMRIGVMAAFNILPMLLNVGLWAMIRYQWKQKQHPLSAGVRSSAYMLSWIGSILLAAWTALWNCLLTLLSFLPSTHMSVLPLFPSEWCVPLGLLLAPLGIGAGVFIIRMGFAMRRWMRGMD